MPKPSVSFSFLAISVTTALAAGTACSGGTPAPGSREDAAVDSGAGSLLDAGAPDGVGDDAAGDAPMDAGASDAGGAATTHDGGALVAMGLALGGSSCALLAGGAIACWGDNEYGQLGDGTTTARDAPVAVVSSPGVRLLGATVIGQGDTHTCAVLGAGNVSCWGESGDQLGNGILDAGDTSATPTPLPVVASNGVPLTGAVSVTAGLVHTCAPRERYRRSMLGGQQR